MKVIKTINSWADADMVVALGDICEDRGTDQEYASAKRFFEELNKPFFPIVGNHNYIYDDFLGSSGNRVRAMPGSRKAKLLKFRETFGL